MEELKKWLISWPGIIITLIIFWPMGCILLYIKARRSLKAKRIVLIGIAIFCYLMTFAGISITLESLNDDLGINIFVTILFFSGAIASTIFGVRALKNYNYYKKYVNKIGARSKISIYELAQKMETTPETTINDVRNAIKYNMIKAYIDENEDIIVINDIQNININVEQEPEISVLQCNNCGATNKVIEGKENHCEFCDSILL